MNEAMAPNLPAAVDAIAAMPMGLNAFGAQNMTCTEAELFADMLRVAGYPEQAARFIADHAETDEYGDGHFGMG